MKEYLKSAGWAVAIILAIVLFAQFSHAPSSHSKGITNFDSLTLTPTNGSEGLKVGSTTPTNISNLVTGKGSIIGNASITSSTTKAFDIAVTGARVGDTCFAQAASTTQTSIGFSIVGCSASTTADFLTLLVNNASGAAGVAPYPIASATQYLLIRN